MMESSDNDILEAISCLMPVKFLKTRMKMKCMDEGIVIQKVKIFSCKSANITQDDENSIPYLLNP